MNDKLFKKFSKLYKLTRDLSDSELDLLIGEVFIFRENISKGDAEPDDIDLVERSLKKKQRSAIISS